MGTYLWFIFNPLAPFHFDFLHSQSRFLVSFHPEVLGGISDVASLKSKSLFNQAIRSLHTMMLITHGLLSLHASCFPVDAC